MGGDRGYTLDVVWNFSLLHILPLVPWWTFLVLVHTMLHVYLYSGFRSSRPCSSDNINVRITAFLRAAAVTSDGWIVLKLILFPRCAMFFWTAALFNRSVSQSSTSWLLPGNNTGLSTAFPMSSVCGHWEWKKDREFLLAHHDPRL